MDSLTFVFLVSHLKSNFKQIDKNHDGFVDYDEIKEELENIGMEY